MKKIYFLNGIINFSFSIRYFFNIKSIHEFIDELSKKLYFLVNFRLRSPNPQFIFTSPCEHQMLKLHQELFLSL